MNGWMDGSRIILSVIVGLLAGWQNISHLWGCHLSLGKALKGWCVYNCRSVQPVSLSIHNNPLRTNYYKHNQSKINCWIVEPRLLFWLETRVCWSFPGWTKHSFLDGFPWFCCLKFWLNPYQRVPLTQDKWYELSCRCGIAIILIGSVSCQDKLVTVADTNWSPNSDFYRVVPMVRHISLWLFNP